MNGDHPSDRDDPSVRDDDDAVWEDLVARIGPLATPPQDGTVLDDGGAEAGRGGAPAPGPGDDADATAGGAPAPGPLGGSGPRDHSVDPADGERADREDEHFVPPEAEPLSSPGIGWWAPWIALVGAPVVLAVVALTRSAAPGWLVVACLVVFAGGAAAAVLRLPDTRVEDPGDDGARL